MNEFEKEKELNYLKMKIDFEMIMNGFSSMDNAQQLKDKKPIKGEE